MRILLVDDDEALMETLAGALIKQRYAVDIAVDGETAHEFLALFSYDVIVLDMLLPDIEGTALCRQFREQGVDSPILMLTAKDKSTDKVRALDAGADDYVIKPFDFDELCARIRALLRRDGHVQTDTLRWGELSLKPNTFEVFYGEHQIHTTPKEYALLELLLRNPNRVFGLDTIIENLWSFQDPPSEDAVRTHVKGLRQKLKAGGAPKDVIETVYGLGYRLKPVDAEATSQTTSTSVHVPAKSEIAAAIATAWDTHKDTMQERLSVLEAVVAALNAGQLSEELQCAGRSQAHKLAGSLGCFGFPEGSRLARELEQLLQISAPLSHQQSSHLSMTVQQLRQQLDDSATPQTVDLDEDGPQPMLGVQAPLSAPEIWIVGGSESFYRALSAAAAAARLCAVAVSNLTQAQNRLQHQTPAGILLWLDDADVHRSMALLTALQSAESNSSNPARRGDGATASAPVLVLTDSQNFHQRLQIVQQGADRILPTSTSPQAVVEIIQTMHHVVGAEIKVMVVDDDPHVLDFVRTLLSPWGFKLTTLDNTEHLDRVLEAAAPDLLILDIEMPAASGLDICRVLRADEKWRQLPILFLTVHEEIDIQHQAYSAGADDFINKSTMAKELPIRILNRLKRKGYVFTGELG